MDTKSISFSHWCTPSKTSVEIRVSPIGQHGDLLDPRLSERATIIIESGVARLQFCPTRDEARALIEALEWALQPVEQAASEAA